MSCRWIKNGIVCFPNIYRFGFDTFEFHAFCGPIRLTKDFEPHKVQSKAFFSRVQKWVDLPREQREEFRVYG